MADLTRDQILQKIRRGEKLERADLRGVDLARTALPAASLGRADLDGANLEGINLRNAVLRHASLREAYLIGADLRDANLEGADLEDANLERAVLIGANLTRANLEGANLAGANLAGARLSFAQLGSANLSGADLRDALLTHADLPEAYLGGVKAAGADFSAANLQAAVLAEGDFTRALFTDATLIECRAGGSKLGGASLLKADLTRADLIKADLSHVDARQANLSGAQLQGACLTGAKVSGLIGTGAPLGEVQVAWVDASPEGDGADRVTDGEIPFLLSGVRGGDLDTAGGRSRQRRYFGRGDVLRNATLEFEDGAHVEIDSLIENCSIKLGASTELVVGRAGVLADCAISGGGDITVHGHFFESASPGIVGPRALRVTGHGALVSAVQQPDGGARFAFDRGCRLRLKVLGGGPAAAADAPAREPDSQGAQRAGAAGTERRTVIEEGTTFKGILEASCPVVVMGRLEGEIIGGAVEVTPTGVISGKIRAATISSRGELAGEFEADDIELGGRVLDKTVLRAKTLAVAIPAPTGGEPPALAMVLGECELRIGDEPSKEQATSDALAPPRSPQPAAAAAATGPAPSAPTAPGDTSPHTESAAPPSA